MIEQGLEEVMVVAVDQGDSNARLVAEHLGGIEAGKTPPPTMTTCLLVAVVISEARRAWGARKEEHRAEIGKFRGEHAELLRR